MNKAAPDDPDCLATAPVGELSREHLVAHWQSIYGCQPPKGVKSQLLERAYSYSLQERQFGGLKVSTKRQLLKWVRSGFDEASKRASKPRIAEGHRLIREWQGQTHIVDVVPDGFCWQGKTYGSLSAIATEITGTRWSGPRFFGVQ